jgi:alkanesulfonate monooxygenase SsuD/methylene tetrahydromethanopterin reductase-like flavin-dependent oxidoreductase (luciferase family)
LRLGLHIGYWGLGMSAQEQLDLVVEAEKLGYDSVWTAEAYGSDAATILSWLAGQTERVKLGSAIFQMPGRSAAMTAMTAATIDQLSGGRMLLGIGSSGPQVAEASSSSARASTSRSCGWRWRASAWCSTAKRCSSRCRTGPGRR